MVTMTRKWYLTLCYPKMHPHTILVIPASNNGRYMLRTQYSRNEVRGRGQGHSPQNGTLHPVIPRCIHTTYVSTHHIWDDSYLKKSRRCIPDTIILGTRSVAKVNKVIVTQRWYATHYLSKTHPHTQFRIPTSNNVEDMFRIRLF